MKPAIFLAVAAMLACTAGSAQTEADTPLGLQGNGPYYRLTLPASLYGKAAYPDLRDLRIRNASGNAVPWAWFQDEAAAPRLLSQKVPLFALPANAVGTVTDALLTFQVRSNGSLALVKPDTTPAGGAVAWIIDTSQVKGNLLQARFEVAPPTSGVFGFSIEASEDLRNWRSVSGNEQLVKLNRDNQHLERLAVDLGGIRARFLRLRWSGLALGAPLTAVSIDSEQSVEAATPQEWSGAITPEHCEAGYCDYRLPRGLPARSLRIALADTNTLAQVDVLGIPDPVLPESTAKPLLRPLHNPLYVLRRQREATRQAAPNLPGPVLLARSVIYRLTQGQVEARSPELALDGLVYQKLRLRTEGPVTLLGAKPPTIAVATTPRTLVFLAQGTAPFKLAWQTAPDPHSPSASGAAMPLATLVPGYSANRPITADSATLSLATTATAVPAAATPVATAAGSSAKRSAWLWAALAGGLALLAGMAWSLFAGMKKAG